MCGIVGLWDFEKPINPLELDQFTDSLTHRGPDGRGTFIEGNVGLGHRRLAILDPSEAGKNPMPYGGANGQRYWITYNGEVYNFLELRRELGLLGHRFRSQTDTEVVVAAYAQWGSACLLRFNGMWALAIWDTLERKLFLARDRFSIKPLYYSIESKRLAFASELKAFLALSGFSVKLNESLVPQLLQNAQAYEGGTHQTIMEKVHRLLGGHALLVAQDGRITINQWWETREHIPAVPTHYAEQVEQFQELLLDAVRIRMRSDVPIGTCLSGGVDSSAISCTMAWLHSKKESYLERCNSDWQRAFVATFPNTFLDEKVYADEVIKHIRSKPHYWVFDNEEALKYLIDSVWTMEEVYPGIAVPVWCLYREMRQQKTIVSLDGHGGDELLGGYPWYLDCLENQVNQNLYQDFHVTLLPSILRNYDRCAMAHGIEVRMPLMDWRLVTFAFGLPANSKMGAGYTKRVLRDAMKDIVPDSIRFRRAKIGFNSPMIEWYNGGMAGLLRKVVNHQDWLNSPFWEGPKLRDYVLAKINARSWTMADWGASLQIWTRVNLILWQWLFVERGQPLQSDWESYSQSSSTFLEKGGLETKINFSLEHDKSWQIYHQAIQQYQPNNARAYKMLGDSLRKMGKLEVAAQSYLKTISIEPYFMEAYLSLGEIFAEQGHLEKAVTYYYQALAIQPDVGIGYWNLSQVLQKQGQLEASQAYEIIALELQPDLISAEEHLVRGHQFFQQNQLEEAISSYYKATLIAPGWEEAHSYLTHSLQQRWPPVPSNAQWHLKMGNALANQGQLEMATKNYNVAIALHPGCTPLINWNLGLALRQQSRFQEAVMLQKQAFALDFRLAGLEIWLQLGDLLAIQGDISKAIEYYQKALEIKPDWQEAHAKLQKLLTAPN